MSQNNFTENQQNSPTLSGYDAWQWFRLGLTGLSFGMTVLVTFFTLLAPFDLLLKSLNHDTSILPIASCTLILLGGSGYLYRWVQNLVDSIFFPDSAGFWEKVGAACQVLAEIDAKVDLEYFLMEELPKQLQIDYVSLQELPNPALALPLEMGGRNLGTLFIGPKCSGRSFSREEREVLKQLQEQVSLVVSVVQLAEAREQAEKTNELKNNFLTNVSNELRTPLNAVINLTGLVADEALGPISGEQKDYLDRAVNGSEYLMRLLDDILDMTKIETGELTLNLGAMALTDVIEEVLPMLQSMVKNKPIVLKMEIAEDLPLLLADRLRIRQILLNLLSNAAKFTREGFIRLKACPENNKVMVSVEDTGVGIAEEDLTLIFQDYQQIIPHNHRSLPSTRRRHFGTGLGMPITQALVALHGGQITVKSVLGEGTIFTFTLPHLLSRPESENLETVVA
jgi:signal transduction histidine kinase